MIRVACCQINFTVGAVQENKTKVIEAYNEAKEHGADIVVFPEQAVVGYPAEDLLASKTFLEETILANAQIARATKGPIAVFGSVTRRGGVRNSALVAFDGALQTVYEKEYLPNYGVFDDLRYFEAGSPNGDEGVFTLSVDETETTVGISVCEDIWVPGGAMLRGDEYRVGLHINLSASPYHLGKQDERKRMLAQRAVDHGCFVVYCNMVGGQDEVVYDGNSCVFDPFGNVIMEAPSFVEGIFYAEIDDELFTHQQAHRGKPYKRPSRTRYAPVFPTNSRKELPGHQDGFEQQDELCEALILGIRDYTRKNGFEKVVLGLSGGVDSAVVASLACRALGPENVTCISMPTVVNSKETKLSAVQHARQLGCEFLEVDIEDIFMSFRGLYDSHSAAAYTPREPINFSPLALENMQARIRGVFLMSWSNTHGALVLACGNKSELATGYATLYGDMVGGFSPLKDVYKTDVLLLAERLGISRDIIERPPSAELSVDQKDTDTLPPYEELDRLLRMYVDQGKSILDQQNGRFITNLVDKNEYKRRQMCPGIKVSKKAFGRDRRLPITNGFKEADQ